MHRLFFWLNWHAGDLLLTRPLVRQVLATHDVRITYGCWKNQAYIVEDLPVEVIADPRDDPKVKIGHPPSLMHLCPPDHLPIYLWVGQYEDTIHHVWSTMVELYNRQVTAQGFSSLQISNKFVPMVDFPDAGIRIGYPGVFIENGVARSKHSDFEFDIPKLATRFPQLQFYCTSDPLCRLPNVVDCSTLNLRELSTVSNQCIAIAGKGSGPFCSTLTEFNRYKPRAIMRYHPLNAGHTIWDYPGNPMHYLETEDELIRFLETADHRRRCSLSTGGITQQEGSPSRARYPETTAAEIGQTLSQFMRHAADPALDASIRDGLSRVIEFWKETPVEEFEYAYRGAWGKLNRQWIAMRSWSFAGEEPLTPPPSFGRPLEAALSTNVYEGEDLRYVILSMLQSRPQDLQGGIDFRRLPDWLRSDYLCYVFQFVDFVERVGESERVFTIREATYRGLAECLREEAPRPHHRLLALQVMQLDALHRHLLTEKSVKAAQCDHGKIIDTALRGWGFPVDHAPPPRTVGRRPRVGILTQNLGIRDETFANLPLYEHLASTFDVFLYVAQRLEESIESYAASRVHALKYLTNELSVQSSEIRQDDLDILLFGTDFAVHNRMTWLGLHRLARVQIAANSSVTTGLPMMDAFLTGELVEKGSQPGGSYSEKRCLVLPGSGLCFSRGAYRPLKAENIDRAALQLPPDAVVFGAFSGLIDIAPELIRSWAKILSETPHSYLLMLPFDTTRYPGYRQAPFFDYVASQLREFGVDAQRLRIVNLDPFPNLDTLQSFMKVVDVYLDGFPINRHGYVAMALQLGIPTMVRRGLERRSNLSAALIEELSLTLKPYLIAENADVYVHRGVILGTNASLRADLQEQIRQAIHHANFMKPMLFAEHLINELRSLIE